MAKKKSSSAEAVKTLTGRALLQRFEQKRAVKPYDAERSFGTIPGLAERMAEYMRTMRDDR